MPKLTKAQKALRHAVATAYPQIGVMDYSHRNQSWGDFLTLHECELNREALLYWMGFNSTNNNLILSQHFVPIRSRPMRKRGSVPKPRTKDEWMEVPDQGPDYLPKLRSKTFDKERRLPSKRVGAYVQDYDMDVYEDVDWHRELRWVVQVVFHGDPGQKPRTKLVMHNNGIFPRSWDKLFLAQDFITRAYNNAESKYAKRVNALPFAPTGIAPIITTTKLTKGEYTS